MERDVYQRFRAWLDTHPVGAPESENIIEILQIMYTPEEAELNMQLPITPTPISEIAKNTGMPEKELKANLDKMADKGLAFRNSEENTYHAWSTCPGLWEICFAKGDKTPETERLAHLWREYYKEGWWKEMHRAKTPLTQIFPIEQSLDAKHQVMPYEQAAEHVKNASYVCVMNCTCRTAAWLDGRDCGHPRETCILMGELARYMVEIGRARESNYEEAKEILRMTAERGLVQLGLSQKELGDPELGICSCCRCCCTQLRASTELGKHRAVAPSRFEPVWDKEDCTYCETCIDRCPMSAISFEDEEIEINWDECFGCGVCVVGCPTEALALKERADYEQPPETLDALFKRFLQEKEESLGH